jgi:hypothetical protein
MIDLEMKRRPGIPDRTLEHIAKEAGGEITRFIQGRDKWVRLEIGNKTFEAPNNTALLILIFGRLNEL